MTTTRLSTPNLGPSDLKSEGENPFALSRSEWFTIQRYVLEALQLPTTEPAMRQAIRMLQEDSIEPFQPLMRAYSDVKVHCSEWQKTIFPATVQLANDIRNYSSKAKIYYAPILPLADKLFLNPNDELSKQKLRAILENLSTDAKNYASNAEDVSEQIKGFANNSVNDQKALNNLYQHYNQEFGESSEEAKKLQKDLDDNMAILKQANQEYEKNVHIAVLTPTYAWVGLIGLIAAAVVAGIHGDKAVKAKRAAEEAQAKIDLLNDKIRRNTRLMINIQNGQGNMKVIQDMLAEALPVIQKIQGVWTALSNDLNYIVEIIDNDITKAPVLIMDLGVEHAMDQWEKIGKLADGYVANAFVTTENQPPAIA